MIYKSKLNNIIYFLPYLLLVSILCWICFVIIKNEGVDSVFFIIPILLAIVFFLIYGIDKSMKTIIIEEGRLIFKSPIRNKSYSYTDMTSIYEYYPNMNSKKVSAKRYDAEYWLYIHIRGKKKPIILTHIRDYQNYKQLYKELEEKTRLKIELEVDFYSIMKKDLDKVDINTLNEKDSKIMGKLKKEVENVEKERKNGKLQN